MIDSSPAPQHVDAVDVAVPEPPPPDLSLPPGAIACGRPGSTLTAADAKAVRDFAAYLEQQQGAPPPTADEPLPPACMNGTCACPSAPDGADQHVEVARDAFLTDPPCTRKGCGRPRSEHELDGTFCP